MEEINKFLKDNEKDFIKLENNKIKCLLTSHEMPINYVLTYIKSKSYLKALRNQKNNDILTADTKTLQSIFNKYIVVHKSDKSKVYCTVTNRILNRDIDEIKAHLNGKRYKYYSSTKKARRDEINAKRQEKQNIFEQDMLEIFGNKNHIQLANEENNNKRKKNDADVFGADIDNEVLYNKPLESSNPKSTKKSLKNNKF